MRNNYISPHPWRQTFMIFYSERKSVMFCMIFHILHTVLEKGHCQIYFVLKATKDFSSSYCDSCWYDVTLTDKVHRGGNLIVGGQTIASIRMILLGRDLSRPDLRPIFSTKSAATVTTNSQNENKKSKNPNINTKNGTHFYQKTTTLNKWIHNAI